MEVFYGRMLALENCGVLEEIQKWPSWDILRGNSFVFLGKVFPVKRGVLRMFSPGKSSCFRK